MKEYVIYSSIYINIKNKLFRDSCFNGKLMKKNSNYYIGHNSVYLLGEVGDSP